jgi:hypothetical protein
MTKTMVALIALATAAGAGFAATSVRPMSLAELVRASDCVVYADVEATRSEWSSDGKMIYTYVTLKVRECWKGAPAERVVVRVPGGRVGQVQLNVSEAPAYAVGERTTAFLKATLVGGGAPVVETTGWFRGKFTVAGGKIRELKNVTLDAMRSDVQTEVARNR